MDQIDYLQQKKSLEDNITRIKGELTSLHQDSIFSSNLSEEVFVQKSGQFLMSASLKNGLINFKELTMHTDAKILKEFVNAVLSRIRVRNGHVTELEFNNGQLHYFEYET